MKASILKDRVKSKFAPPPRLLVSQWAEKKRYLSPEASAEPGRWKNDRAPYLVGIMDATNEPGVNQIVVMCSSQVGKTEVESNVIGYTIELDPCPILFIQPSLEMAQGYSKDRFDPMVRDSPTLTERVFANKSRDKNSTILHKKFHGGQLTFAGANSPASLASRPIRKVFFDECDRFPLSAKDEGDPIALAKKRTTTFWNRLIIAVSTPTKKDTSRILKLFENSDQRRYFVPCPHCGEKQHLVWEQIEYVGKGTDEADPESGIYYICISCKTPISQSHKNEMVQSGQWQPTATSKDGSVGFHLNQLYSLWVDWVDTALDYELSRKDDYQYRVWLNTTLGLPYEPVTGEKLNWQKLAERAGNYSQGFVPAGGLILTAGVDVQSDRLEVAIWAWGRGEQAWLIRYEMILGDPLKKEVWEQLEAVVTASYSHESGVNLHVRATAIDSGYLTQEVYHQVRKHKFLHWYAIKGVAGNRPLVSRPTLQEVNYQGERIKHGVTLYTVGVDIAKEILYSRVGIDQPGDKYLNFPSNLDSSWFEGFCSEVQVTKHKNGQPYTVWEKLGGIRNEPLDISIYALAAAHLVGITRIRWGKVEKEIAQQLEEVIEEVVEEKKVKSHRESGICSLAESISSRKKSKVKSKSKNFATSI